MLKTLSGPSSSAYDSLENIIDTKMLTSNNNHHFNLTQYQAANIFSNALFDHITHDSNFMVLVIRQQKETDAPPLIFRQIIGETEVARCRIVANAKPGTFILFRDHSIPNHYTSAL